MKKLNFLFSSLLTISVFSSPLWAVKNSVNNFLIEGKSSNLSFSQKRAYSFMSSSVESLTKKVCKIDSYTKNIEDAFKKLEGENTHLKRENTYLKGELESFMTGSKNSEREAEKIALNQFINKNSSLKSQNQGLEKEVEKYKKIIENLIKKRL